MRGLLLVLAVAAACEEPVEEDAVPASRFVLHVTITSADGPLPPGLKLSVKGASGVEGWTIEHEGAVPPDGEITIDGLAPGKAEAELRGEGFEREVTFYVASDPAQGPSVQSPCPPCPPCSRNGVR